MNKPIYGTHDKAIVFTDSDGTCCIVVLVSGIDPEEHLERLLKEAEEGKYPHQLNNPRIINYPEDIPPNRIFRNAWTDQNPTPTVDIDLEKAKEIHMNRIREIRNKDLSQIDKEINKLVDVGESSVELRTKRQELRDVPQTLDLSKCTTVEELIETWPEDLSEKHPTYVEYEEWKKSNIG